MDELTAKDLDDIRAVVENKDGSIPELKDLPGLLDFLSDHQSADDRDQLVRSYMVFARTKRWAWEGLNELLATLAERGELIPDVLKTWACSVVSRTWRKTLKIPNRPRNPRYAPKDDRNFRIAIVFLVTRRMKDMSREKAIAAIADALDMPPETVTSAVRKMENYKPIKLVRF